MSNEKSGTYYATIIAAVITSLAAITAAYISAGADRRIENLKKEKENLEADLSAIKGQLKICQASQLSPARGSNIMKIDGPPSVGAHPDSIPVEMGVGASPGKDSASPLRKVPVNKRVEVSQVRWITLQLVIPAGLQGGKVLVDGSPARVLSRLPNFIDIQVPYADKPVMIRLEGRSRVCEQLVFATSTNMVNPCEE